MRSRSKSGTSLVLVLVVVAVLVSLIGGATALVSTRTRLLEDHAQQIRLRTLAEQGLAQAARNLIDADTNGWDSLDETWGTYQKFSHFPESSHCADFRPGDKFELQIEDEYGRVGMTNGTLRCEEDLLLPENLVSADFGEFPSRMIRTCSFTTCYTDGTINLNTISKEAFFLLCSKAENHPQEYDPESGVPLPSSATAETLWNRLESIRFRGGVFHRATAEEALRIFQEYPTGVPPSATEMTLLGRLQPYLRSQGGMFRLTARVSHGRNRVLLQVVYERTTHRIVRWAEM